MQRLETESKFELTPEAFERLKALGNIARQEDQLNVYYDAQWKLAEHSATLRVRFHAGARPVLTLKLPVSHAGSHRVMKEFEVVLSNKRGSCLRSPRPNSIDIETQLPKQFRDRLRELGITQVQRVGWVRNMRVVVIIENMGQLELDRLELPDGSVVHEVEIESRSESVRNHLADVVCRYAPDAMPSKINKFQRFRLAATIASGRTTCPRVAGESASNVYPGTDKPANSRCQLAGEVLP